MAYIEIDKQIVISAASAKIAKLNAKRKAIDDALLLDYQKPSIWNLWRGSKSIPLCSIALSLPRLSYLDV